MTLLDFDITKRSDAARKSSRRAELKLQQEMNKAGGLEDEMRCVFGDEQNKLHRTCGCEQRDFLENLIFIQFQKVWQNFLGLHLTLVRAQCEICRDKTTFFFQQQEACSCLDFVNVKLRTQTDLGIHIFMFKTIYSQRFNKKFSTSV